MWSLAIPCCENVSVWGLMKQTIWNLDLNIQSLIGNGNLNFSSKININSFCYWCLGILDKIIFVFSISNVFDLASFLTYTFMAVVKYQYSYWKAGRVWVVFDVRDPLFNQATSEFCIFLFLKVGRKVERLFKKKSFSRSLFFFLSYFLNSCNPMPPRKQRAEHHYQSWVQSAVHREIQVIQSYIPRFCFKQTKAKSPN